MSARCVIEVNFDRLRQELNWYIAEQLTEGVGGEAIVERIATDVGCPVRSIRRVLEGSGCESERAARILDAIGYRDGPRRAPTGSGLPGSFLPLVIRSHHLHDGRARQPGELGRIKVVDFKNALLSERQLRAIHTLHVGSNLSLREICRRGWEQWGFASHQAACNSVYERLASIGLETRSQPKATALANTQRRKRPAGETPTEYKRRKRQELYAADPAAHRAALDRVLWLRERARQRAVA